MITTKNLSKRYGDKLAVNDLSFSVQPGEVLGFLGANGAGKSTTMRMIAGFIAPSTGRVTVCGHDIERAPVAAKSCMGYLPEGAPSYGEMTVAEFLDFVAGDNVSAAEEVGGFAPGISPRAHHDIPQRHVALALGFVADDVFLAEILDPDYYIVSHSLEPI